MENVLVYSIGNFNVEGNLIINEETLVVVGNLTVAGDVVVKEKLIVTGDLTVAGDLIEFTAGAVCVNGNLNVSGTKISPISPVESL